jgi:CheY-like chemotaxis protein
VLLGRRLAAYRFTQLSEKSSLDFCAEPMLGARDCVISAFEPVSISNLVEAGSNQDKRARKAGLLAKVKVLQRSKTEKVFMSLTVILNIGEDRVLLETRSAILRTAGYTVESTRSLKQAIERSLAGGFDLVILCHSIAPKDRDLLTSWIRASGSLTPVVSILESSGQGVDLADVHLEHEPRKLLRGIKDVVSQLIRKCPTMARNADVRSAKGNTWRKTILCIDDEPNLLVLRRGLLQRAGYLVLTTNNGSEGLKVFSTGMVDAVVLDYAMPLMNGGAVAARMREMKEDVPLILLSGGSTIPEEDLALFDRFISKGEPPSMLLSAIEDVLSAPAEQTLTVARGHSTLRGGRKLTA